MEAKKIIAASSAIAPAFRPVERAPNQTIISGKTLQTITLAISPSTVRVPGCITAASIEIETMRPDTGHLPIGVFDRPLIRWAYRARAWVSSTS